MVLAPWSSGCVRVTTEVTGDAKRFFVLNTGGRSIHVFAKKATPPAGAEDDAPVAATSESAAAGQGSE